MSLYIISMVFKFFTVPIRLSSFIPVFNVFPSPKIFLHPGNGL